MNEIDALPFARSITMIARVHRGGAQEKAPRGRAGRGF